MGFAMLRGMNLQVIVLAQMLLSASVAFAGDVHPSCELAKESVLSRSTTGVPQVSNLGGIRVKCRVPQRPFPTKPGEYRNGLRAETAAYDIGANGTKMFVPSEVNVVGGGFGPEPEPEWVDFYVHIPLDSKELDAEARKYLAKLEASMTPSQKGQLAEDVQKKALGNLRQVVDQNRTGHFKVECRILDGTRVMGVDIIELEVLFKGNFSNLAVPGSPPA